MPMKAMILAAGKGSRMQSDIPKVLHKLNNKTLIERVISISEKIKISISHVLVIDNAKDDVEKNYLSSISGLAL